MRLGGRGRLRLLVPVLYLVSTDTTAALYHWVIMKDLILKPVLSNGELESSSLPGGGIEVQAPHLIFAMEWGVIVIIPHG